MYSTLVERWQRRCVQVNGVSVESSYHDDAVTLLKNAGDSVLLTLRYFEPASGFLSLKGTDQGGYIL